MVPPDQLLANPLNARRHPVKQREALKSSLTEIGWVIPIIVNETTGYLVDGHARVEEALKAGVKKVPVVTVRLSPEQEKLALGVLDRITPLADYDKEVLDCLLHDISTGEASLQELISELADEYDLLSDLEEQDKGNGGDDFDSTPANGPTRCQPGDLWIIGGGHRLIIGDCTERATINRLMQGEMADAVITDPPYGMRLDADFSGMTNKPKFAQEKGVKSGRKYNNVIGDHEDYDASIVRSVMQDAKEQFWFGADYYSSSLGDTMHGGAWLVWDKRLDESSDKMFGSCFELVWSQKKHKRDILRHKWAGIFGTEHEPQRGREHPNQKPVRLIEDIINRYIDHDALIFDGYLGSGTTLIAAHRTGRRCYGCEIEPRYGDVILRRAEAEGLTVEKAG